MNETLEDPRLGIIDPDQMAREALHEHMSMVKDEDEKIAWRMKITAFTQDLDKILQDSVTAKAPIESRWIDDVRQLNGLDRMTAFSKDDIAAGRHNNNPPSSQVTRAKQMLWEAKLVRILGGEDAWDLDVSAKPELPQAGLDALSQKLAAAGLQRPPTAEELREAARPACEGMKNKIKDDLQESDIGSVRARTFRDATRLGTGLEIGPFQQCKYRSMLKFVGSQVQIEHQEYIVPQIKEGDPWMFYPEPAPAIEKCQYAHYIDLMSETELVENIKNGYDPESVKTVIEIGPDHSIIQHGLEQRNLNSGESENYKNRFAIRRYTGVLNKEQRELLGLDEEGATRLLFTDESMKPMLVFNVHYVPGHVLYAEILPCLGEFRLPYYTFAPFPADDTMWGMSIAFMCRDSARICNSGLRIGLHNASVSAGPLIAMKKGHFKPMDGNQAIRGPKQYEWIDPDGNGVDIDKVFKVVQIENNAEQAFAIYDKGLSMIDMDLNSPNLLGDDPVMASKLQPTTLAMFLNVMTYLQQMAAKQFDKSIIKPQIKALYMWNLIYNEDPAIKGSFDPIARGASHLVVKDIQSQHLQLWANMVAANPKYEAYTDTYEMLKCMHDLMDLPTRKLLLSKEEGDAKAAEAAKGQADPMLEIQRMKAETEKFRAERDAEDKDRDDKFRSEKFMLEQDAKRESDRAMMTIKMMERDIALARLAVDEKITIEEVKAKHNMHATDAALKETFGVMEARMKAQEIASRDREMDLKRDPANLDPENEGI